MIRTEKGYAQLYKIFGRSETEVKETLKELLGRQLPLPIYTRRRFKEIQVLIETTEQDEDAAKALVKPVAKEVKKALGTMYYSTKELETMEEAVVKLLLKKELTVSTAESCTGGMIASKLVNVAGASEVFNEGYVTYSDKAKRKILGVEKATLKKHGAVSRQTARKMVLGVMKTSEADCGVAVTGIAGPDGGTLEKPVGLVYIACGVRDVVVVEECHFHGTRAEVREQSALYALDLLRRTILKTV